MKKKKMQINQKSNLKSKHQIQEQQENARVFVWGIGPPKLDGHFKWQQSSVPNECQSERLPAPFSRSTHSEETEETEEKERGRKSVADVARQQPIETQHGRAGRCLRMGSHKKKDECFKGEIKSISFFFFFFLKDEDEIAVPSRKKP